MTKRNRRMNLLYLPALVLVLMFVLLPLLTSIKTSFYNWNGYSPVKKFIGMKNYLDLLQDENFKTAKFKCLTKKAFINESSFFITTLITAYKYIIIN